MLNKVKNKIKNTKNLFFPSNYRKLRQYYARNYETLPVDENMILYETRDGKSIVDSPYALFLSLAKNPKYANFKHVWVVSEKNKGIEENIPKELLHKVTFVYRNTTNYVKAMLEAKYLISNSTFESFFVKRQDQIYINTWHGTPIKKMGFDVPGALSNSQNVLRNFLMVDYLLSPNEHTSNVFTYAYKLADIFPGEILEGGYPRIDATFNLSKEQVIQLLSKYGMVIDTEKPIVLYSPTWKGSNAANVSDDIEQLVLETKMLQKSLEGQYQVLIKVHPFAYAKVVEDSRLQEILIPDMINANDVLAVTDVLVTDYSSIFFDFLVTNRPIVFYAWDKDLYTSERGLYLEIEELPGPTAETIEELIGYINDVENQHRIYRDRYKKMAQKMVKYDDGRVTEKYIDYIFDGKKSDNMTIRKINSDKKKILIYPGGMLSNGITSSFINLLNNIDHTKYDVSVLLNQDKRAEVNNNLKRLPANIRPIYRFGSDILTVKENLNNQNIANNGLNQLNESRYPAVGYHREMNRITANLDFDVAIDFSGYSYFWGRHILAANAKKKVVFIHSNIKADSMREVNGKYPMLKGLTSLFSIYKKFDKILSVSPMMRDVNYENLHEYAQENQMSFVYNTINISDILDTPVVQDVTDTITLNVSRRLLEPTNPSEVEVFKNITAIQADESYLLKINRQSNVVQHAVYNFGDQQYVKVSVDYKYVGWIKSQYFVEKAIEIFDVQDYHAFGTVSRAYHYPIIKEIVDRKSEEEVITYIKYFRKKYLETKKIAYTSHGKYLYVKYLDKELGWVLATPIMRLHELTPFSVKNIYFRYRMNKMNEKNPVGYTTRVELVERYGKFISNNEDVVLWSEPKGTTDAREISISECYYDQAFKITELSYVGTQVYAKLTLDSSEFVGYIRTEHLIWITQEEYLEELRVVETNSELPKLDLAKQPIQEFDERKLNFVHMGRLSPEKNQEVLIRAFGEFNQVYPESRLYILGKGPLASKLIQVVLEQQLEGVVILLGHINNPYRFMEKATYFVLPSLYEGQPMVLLEALTLGMKVLASNIPANINVLEADESYGLMTEGTTVEDVYNGLIRIVQHEEAFKVFDYEQYNQTAIQSFYREIEG